MKLSKYCGKVAKARGYKNYPHYLRSPHWNHFKKLYRESGRPLQCKDCHSPTYEFYHVTAKSIAQENFDDVILLCGRCRANRGQVENLKKILPEPNDLIRYDCEKCKNDGRLSNVCICR